MKQLTVFAILLVASFITAVSCDSGAEPPGNEHVWVANFISGGKQCVPEETFTPPDIRQQLVEAGIATFASKVVPHAVCRACYICPAYAAMHYAQIRQRDLSTALIMGFELSESPGT